MNLPAPRLPALSVTVVRNESALVTLRTAWESLEDQAEVYGLYVTWGYVRLAWQHLAAAGDQLWVLVVRDDQDRLYGVLPLVRVTERHYGMALQVLRHIGIWEGDRPGLLALEDADRVWAVLWEALVARRSEWQVLDLRELVSGSWPLRMLQRPGKGFSSETQPDIDAPFQRLDTDWALHVATRRASVQAQRLRMQQRLQAEQPGTCVVVAETPEEISAALERYLLLEKALVQAGSGVTIGSNLRLVAFYRDWLPRLAARGDAAVWLLGGDGGEIAGLIRLRCGDTWIERHACYDPAHADITPSLLLTVEALQHSVDTTADESTLVSVREPDGATASVLDWYDGRSRTQRLSVWNLQSRLGPIALLKGLGSKFRGG
ncbi:GNAT family N-acetyltransferase [Sphaerotilus sp.]|uniref:GNAT family N-acetyltransferase n=1 Tax=Sphaerotilus sp. TaxID=2093942 RepID=UPI00286EA37A|nr:GNAT family N-acetyltransferase [Sphaerotilus sp.]